MNGDQQIVNLLYFMAHCAIALGVAVVVIGITVGRWTSRINK